MMVLMNGFEPFSGNVGVNLRSRYISMPKKQLHNP
jgi:hypothetical protein